MIRLLLGLALLSVLSIFVIPAVLVTTGTPLEVVYVVPFALCVIITIKRLSGSELRKSDELATKFGMSVAERISKTFDLQPRPEPTSEERLIAAAVGTAAVTVLGVVANLLQAALGWYGIIFGLWLIAMFVAWAVRRPNLQQPKDAE
ncbi:cytochrome oxidase assembly protein ShyY1 [Rhizobium soli]|uniref:Cytochrome oxidase assembly protein ShyY1 n=1 Tax=Rhizobium soli TaxID=424798 RepID=A0A7X0MTL6_9HYPH|nr:hypothetical protein [Rhizobium soli]MBB6510571.1 cytochrome oxidase assembly protein ShyY1 [Rhizobium soli]